MLEDVFFIGDEDRNPSANLVICAAKERVNFGTRVRGSVRPILHFEEQISLRHHESIGVAEPRLGDSAMVTRIERPAEAGVQTQVAY